MSHPAPRSLSSTSSRRAALLSVFLSLPLVGALSAMTCGPTDPSPCELDRLGCEPPDETNFYLAEGACPVDLTGPLDIELGTGESAFEAFAPDQAPVVHYGPQGGQHLFMGLRVKNARLDLSPLLKVTYYAGQGPDCMAPEGAAAPPCERQLGARVLILGTPGFDLHKNAQGQVEEYGLVVFLDYPTPDQPGLIAMTVEDPCRRKATVYQEFPHF